VDPFKQSQQEPKSKVLKAPQRKTAGESRRSEGQKGRKGGQERVLYLLECLQEQRGSEKEGGEEETIWQCQGDVTKIFQTNKATRTMMRKKRK